MAETITGRTCKGCDAALVQAGPGRPKVWCSRECRRRNQPPPSQKQAPRSSIHVTNCRYCGVLFVGRNSRSTRCKSEECKKAWNRERQENFTQKWKAKHGRSYTAEWNAKNPERARELKNVYRVECKICGNVYMSSKPKARYCAGKCADIGRFGWPQTARERAEAKQAEARNGSRGATPFTVGPCHQCGVQYVAPPHGGGRPRFCSPRCKGRAKGSRRDARERGAPGLALTPTARWQVYARHEFTCWLCNLPLNMDAHYLEDDAPTIDHVLALAAGGTHEDDNLRPAHRWCNAVKGDRDRW